MPVSYHIKVQGKPGTGKSFVILTLRNINRNIFKSNKFDAVSAPTGCSANLIDGVTHNRLFKIPVGAKTHKVPTDWNSRNAQEIKKWIMSWQQLNLLIMDEDSMAGRPIWAWFEHRCEELRRYFIQPNENNNEIENNIVTHTSGGRKT